MKTLLLTPLLALIFFKMAACYSSTDSGWETSTYFRSDSFEVISSNMGNSTTPTHSFQYSSAFTNTPNMAYGIKQYIGILTVT